MDSSHELNSLNQFLDSKNDENIRLGIQLAKSLNIDIEKYFKLEKAFIPKIFDFYEDKWILPYEVANCKKNETGLIRAIKKVRGTKKLNLALEGFLEIESHYVHKDLKVTISSFEKTYLSDLELSKLEKTSLITEVNLSKKDLREVPLFIFKIANLKTLNLSHNYLSEVPDLFNNLRLLETLSLQFNNLKELPNSIAEVVNLQTLWIAKNVFNEFPKNIANLHKLRELYIFDNFIAKDDFSRYKKVMPHCTFFNR